MSRSRKKNPMFTDHGEYTYYMKRVANKAVRNMSNDFFEDNPKVSAFKRCSNPWDICDYRFGYEGCSFDELVRILDKRNIYYRRYSWHTEEDPHLEAIRYFRK